MIEGQERVPTPETANPPPSTKSPCSAKKAKGQTSKKSGTAAPGTGPGETGPSSKTKRQRPSLAGEGASDTKFGSARHPRSQTAWERLCRMTDMGTGQLRGSVGTPDNPRLTFEEAVRERGMDRDLVLWVGQDIIPAGEDEFPKKRSEADLKRIRNQVDEEQLP